MNDVMRCVQWYAAVANSFGTIKLSHSMQRLYNLCVLPGLPCAVDAIGSGAARPRANRLT